MSGSFESSRLRLAFAALLGLGLHAACTQLGGPPSIYNPSQDAGAIDLGTEDAPTDDLAVVDANLQDLAVADANLQDLAVTDAPVDLGLDAGPDLGTEDAAPRDLAVTDAPVDLGGDDGSSDAGPPTCGVVPCSGGISTDTCNDPTNCGACESVCHGGALCVMGSCASDAGI